jgi:arylsulfatase A-like enzyme
MHRFLIFVSFLIIGPIVSGQTEEKPNIIFIVADDLNDYIEDLGGLPSVNTPNINRIADQGTVFSNAVASSPLCCPSRTSFLTGKDAKYTTVYSSYGYKCNDFSKNFTPAKNNETYFTLPGYFKDNGDYFTYSLNKIFHCYENYQEYDSLTLDPCAKSQSWNKIFVYLDSTHIIPGVNIVDEGVHNTEWSRINDTLEPYMMDVVAVDSSIQFISDYASGNGTCGKPFFLALGIKKPHQPFYIPEKYFDAFYLEDIYATPYDIPYNFPPNSYPPNGLILPPQPEVPFADYYALPTDGMGQAMIKGADENFVEWGESVSPLPVIHPDYSDSLTLDILTWSKRSNCVSAYVAAVRYIDAQVGRLLDSLEAYPEVYNNTIIVLAGDNGYSLSEKRHWGKRDLWETDIRIPFIIADLRNPNQQINKSMVTLLDIFPTLCALADIAPPTFPDGSNYLDGADISELLSDADLVIERPLLSSVLKEVDQEGFCFPQYSVRSDRFHLIHYKSNGGGETSCDEAASYIEQELYEIGINRDKDPNEWNNLIQQSAYEPVVAYLMQWLPTNNMYLKKTFKATMIAEPLSCLLNYSDTLNMSISLFDTLGSSIAAPDGFNYFWTNNLTSDTIWGTTAAFIMSTIPYDIFTANESVFLYFNMVNPETGDKVGFDIREIFINPTSAPEINFNLITNGEFFIDVIDFSISGAYNYYWWEIDGDSLFYNTKPGTYDFDEPGTYNYICNVAYGNSNCITTLSTSKSTNNYNYFRDDILLIIPNPAKDKITLQLRDNILNGSVMIYDMTGKIVKSYNANVNNFNYFECYELGLLPGLYLATYTCNDKQISSPFIILK